MGTFPESPVLAILGPGKLGSSLALDALLHGFRVRLGGKNLDHAETSSHAIRAHLQRHLDRNLMDPSSLDRLRPCLGLADAAQGADILFECLPEDLELKTMVWRELQSNHLLARLNCTGTSSLEPSCLTQQAGLSRPLVAFHLFLPVHRRPIVELVFSINSPAHLEGLARELADRLGKRVIPVKEQAGFAATRLGLIQGLEAMKLLQEGIARAEDLDELMKQGYGHPMGPLELSDWVGLDIRLAAARHLHQSTGRPEFMPPAILEELVSLGHLGRKTGRGFYQWDGNKLISS